MKERSILFSGPMVRAILDGHKTQTRRALNPQPISALSHVDSQIWSDGGSWIALCKFGAAGDRLWVRETWIDMLGTGCEYRNTPGGILSRYAYAADTPAGSYGDQCRKDYGLKWRPSIHMPRVVCRLVLDVTGVRVERLQDISAPDCIAEGIDHIDTRASDVTVVGRYRTLWESINGAGSWEANPWVWVIGFKRAPA